MLPIHFQLFLMDVDAHLSYKIKFNQLHFCIATTLLKVVILVQNCAQVYGSS